MESFNGKLKSGGRGFSLLDLAGRVADLQRNEAIEIGELLVIVEVAKQLGQKQLILLLDERKRLNFAFDEVQQLILLHPLFAHSFQNILSVVASKELYSAIVLLP